MLRISGPAGCAHQVVDVAAVGYGLVAAAGPVCVTLLLEQRHERTLRRWNQMSVNPPQDRQIESMASFALQ